MFHAAIGAEVLGIARATSEYNFFIQSVQILLIRMKKQEANVAGTTKLLNKMINRHASCFAKFSRTTESIISDCIQA